jgi:hypothetical protein
MKRPTIRLGYVMELVVAAAVCFAVVRSQLSTTSPLAHRFAMPIPLRASEWIKLVGGSSLTGMALASGVGLVVETICGRRPASWGLGRWIWSIAGLFSIFYSADLFAQVAIGHLAPGGALSLVPVAPTLLGRAAIYQFFSGFAWAIAAVCTTAMLAGSPRDPEPDTREWAGRLFASLAIALNIAEPLLRAAGH